MIGNYELLHRRKTVSNVTEDLKNRNANILHEIN